jgi:hypothetical protein
MKVNLGSLLGFSASKTTALGSIAFAFHHRRSRRVIAFLTALSSEITWDEGRRLGLVGTSPEGCSPFNLLPSLLGTESKEKDKL